MNGTSSCHHAGLLGPNGLLRTNGFKGTHQFTLPSDKLHPSSGFVVSDWGATHDLPSDNANAGLDMEQPGDWIVIGKISKYFRYSRSSLPSF
jgi:beta-glucosidase